MDTRLEQVVQDKIVLMERVAGTFPAGGRRYVLTRCPVHEDKNPSCAVNADGTWHCFTCNIGGDALDWIGFQQYGRAWTSRGEQLKHVVDIVASLGVTPLTPQERKARSYQPNPQPEAIASTRARLAALAYQAHENLLEHPERAEAFYAWGINDREIVDGLLGWDGERFTFPAMYRGVVFGIKRRLPPEVMHTPKNPKYISIRGSTWGLYGADTLHEHPQVAQVVVCEDEKSALALRSAGYCSIASNGGCGFWRSRNSNWWVSTLAGAQEVIFWRDADEPGLRCALDFRVLVPRAVIVDSGELGFKDAGDLIAAGRNPQEVLYA